MQKIITSIRTHGLPIDPPIFDHTFHHYGERKKVWFVGFTHTLNNKTYYKASFGDVTKSLSVTLDDWSEEPSPEEVEEMKKIILKLEEEREAQRREKWDELATLAQYTWNQCPVEFSPTPYSLRKGIKSAFGARNLFESGLGSTIIAVPLRDVDGKMWNIQRIFSQKDQYGNDKSFLEGARVDGLFSISNELECPSLPEAKHLVLSEGYATAATISAIIKESGGERVCSISCANAGNLIKVAESIRARFPDLLFTVAADNDYQKTNAGVEAAVKLAKHFGAKIVVPPAEDGITDWNDYYLKYGIDEAKRCFYSSDAQLLDISVPIKPSVDKPKKLSDHAVAKMVIQSFGNNIIREDTDDYFIWNGNHWVHQNPNHFPFIIKQKLVAASGSGSAKDMDGAFRLFRAFMLITPRNLFNVQKYRANFQDGTLHANPVTKQVFFLPHNREDFMNFTIPFRTGFPFGEITQAMCNEKLALLPKENDFLRYIDGTFGREYLPTIFQTYAAGIIPSYPRIIMAIGNPGSGKSTFGKILMAFLDPRNVATQQPCSFDRFGKESMVGKLLNFVDDLELKKPMNDAELKTMISQAPQNVDRKNKTQISAILPYLHIFCGNDMPRSLDLPSGAYTRRMTPMKTLPHVRNIPDDAEFVPRVVQDSGEFILLSSISAFFTLLEQKGFKHTEESLRQVEEWQDGGDSVKRFLEDLLSGEFNTSQNEFSAELQNGNRRIPCKTLYLMYAEWYKKFVYHNPPGFHNFDGRMEKLGYPAMKDDVGKGTGFRKQKRVFDLSVKQAEGASA